MIIFNTRAKAEHYLKWYSKRNYCDINIIDDKIYVTVWEERYCGASEPEEGYICCDLSEYVTYLLGKIKKKKLKTDEKDNSNSARN